MSTKRRARSPTSSTSSSSSNSSGSASSGTSSSSTSSDDERRQNKSQPARKRARSKSPKPEPKQRSSTQAEQQRSSRHVSPDKSHEKDSRAATASRRHSGRRSMSPAHRQSGRSSRDRQDSASRHHKVEQQPPRHDRQRATDARHDRHDRHSQQDRSHRERRDDDRSHRGDRPASRDDRRREDQHSNGHEPARPDRAQDLNGRDANDHNSKRHRSGDVAEQQQTRAADASRSNRDATGLPPPPPGRTSQDGGRGRPPKGPGDRQNRWAQDGPLDNVPPGQDQWGKPGNEAEGRKGKEDKPEPEANFALSGKLAAESNTVKGVVLVHQEPPEARKPAQMWRLYGFKNGEPIDKPLYIHRQTCYLFGRERRVADVPLDHPSISKQHAVLQYRFTDKEGADGMMHSEVRPYLMDLGSANGTYLNNERIETERYYELLEKDMVRFGHSTREYVLLHSQSND